MKLHDIFFWCATSFLIGIFIFSVASHYFTRPPELPSGKVEITGVITEAEQRINSQKLIVGDIQITTGRYPEFEYGDEVKVAGTIQPPAEEFAAYYRKEGIRGIMSFPEIEVVGRGQGSPVKAALLSIKDFFKESFKKSLPFDRAAFMSGLTLGDTSEFSDEFREKLQLTGTNHLVALSGYNISVIVRSLGFILAGWWLTKRLKFPLTVLFILAFVVMTGAEASVVRAAIMGSLVLLADQARRPYYLRNAVAAAALAMALFNPNILAFDVGFQLSFAALMGIVYLRPRVQKWLRMGDKPGILNWREHFLSTTSAQLAVLPVIIWHFGYFSPIGILSNVLILEFIPITTVLGFFLGFAAAIWQPLAWLVSLPAQAFLLYELTIIDLASRIMNFL